MIMSVSALQPAAIGCDIGIESVFSAARDSLTFKLISRFGRQQNLISFAEHGLLRERNRRFCRFHTNTQRKCKLIRSVFRVLHFVKQFLPSHSLFRKKRLSVCVPYSVHRSSNSLKCHRVIQLTVDLLPSIRREHSLTRSKMQISCKKW